MLEINLLPVREARRKADIRQQLMQLMFVLLLTTGAIGFWHSRVADEISMSEVRVMQMQNDIKQFKPQLDQVAAFKIKKARLEKKIDVIDGLDKARSGPVHVLAELASRTPERLWLTGVDSKGGEIRMEGRSLDNELVAKFLRGLGDSKYFAQVDLDSTQIVDGRDGLKVVKFAIRAQIVNPDAAAGSCGTGRSGDAASGGGEGRVRGGAPWKFRRSSRPGSIRSRSSRSRRGQRSSSASPRSSSPDTTSSSTPAMSEKLDGLRANELELQRKLSEVRSVAANLAAFEEEIANLELKLSKVLRQLPNEKELEVLLTDISNLGKKSGIEIKSFKRLEEVPHDFYAEVPITIEIEGEYHNLGRFFDLMSDLPRIVNMGSMTVRVSKESQESTRLKVTGTLTTFRFVGDDEKKA